MTKKIATINLIDFRYLIQYVERGQHFRIESCIDSIDFVAGSYLEEEKVKELIYSPEWRVKTRQPRNSDF